MRTKREPTHVLVVEVPVYLDDEYDFDPVQDAIKAVLSISRAAFADAICGDPTVTIRDGSALSPSSNVTKEATDARVP